MSASEEIKPLLDFVREKYKNDVLSDLFETYLNDLIYSWESSGSAIEDCSLCGGSEDVRIRHYEWLGHGCFGGQPYAESGSLCICLNCFNAGWIFPKQDANMKPSSILNIRTRDIRSIRLYYDTSI